jgi:LmbE family N-acetylglucosaminyl deacetylase
VSSVDMLNFADGLLNNAPEMMVRERLVIAIRTHKPMAVFTWSPYLDFEMYVNGREHPDHRTTGQIVLDAVYPSARGACVCVCVCVCLCVSVSVSVCACERAVRLRRQTTSRSRRCSRPAWRRTKCRTCISSPSMARRPCTRTSPPWLRTRCGSCRGFPMSAGLVGHALQ